MMEYPDAEAEARFNPTANTTPRAANPSLGRSCCPVWYKHTIVEQLGKAAQRKLEVIRLLLEPYDGQRRAALAKNRY